MLDRLSLVVMICATWLWFHQSDYIVLKWQISWEKSKTPSIVDMGYICIILIFQWNKLMGTQWIEDTTSLMSFSRLCRQIGDRTLHLDTRFAILWWTMSRILKLSCCKRKYTSPYESSGRLSWLVFAKGDEKGRVASSNMSHFAFHLRNVVWESMFHLDLHVEKCLMKFA